MNVRCQSCDTVYRIDPLKVPVEGVHARCTVCSAIIPIERSSEADAPATDRPMTAHAPSTEDRVAHALGDAFIPAPHDEEGGAAVADAPPESESEELAPDVTDDLSPEEREAERNSERQAVESMPGIIMPPAEDELGEGESASEPIASTDEPAPGVDTESDTVPIEPIAPRVSRPVRSAE